jgi:hypothetical protein
MITKSILALTLSLTLLSCNNTVSNDGKKVAATDSLKTVSIDSFYVNENEVTSDFEEYKPNGKEPKIEMNNSSLYSISFIEELKKQSGYECFALKDSVMIVNKTDTFTFPASPKIGEQMILTGKKGKLAIALTLKRVNYTSIDYKIEMVEFGKTNHIQSGQAHIPSNFFLGDESDEDIITGLSYSVNQFIDNREKDCYAHIRLGELNKSIVAKLIKNCNGKITDITLDNFTILQVK